MFRADDFVWGDFKPDRCIVTTDVRTALPLLGTVPAAKLSAPAQLLPGHV